MYFGSVRFFKHLIVTVLTIIFLLPAASIPFLFLRAGEVNGETKNLKEDDDSIGGRGIVTALLEEAGEEKISAYDLVMLLSGFDVSFDELFSAYIEIYEVNNIPLDSEPPPDDEILEISYHSLYPELYVEKAPSYTRSANTVYLTFDDGPSLITTRILDILDDYNIKATFFITGWTEQANSDIVRDIAARGHSIGIHSYSHDYTQIYTSVDAFLRDFNSLFELILETTGQRADFFRFPGGSLNTYNQGIYQEIITEMYRRGFVYYDWNASGLDAVSNIASRQIINNVIGSMKGSDRYIVLLHDSSGRTTTAQALPEIIESIIAAGYTFEKITNDVRPITFSYLD